MARTYDHASQCRYPAIYRGSLVEFHGPVFVTLDWEIMDRVGTGLSADARYVVYTPSGEVLRGARAKSLDFSPTAGKQVTCDLCNALYGQRRIVHLSTCVDGCDGVHVACNACIRDAGIDPATCTLA